MSMSRKETIDYLVGNEIFRQEDVDNKEQATEYYIKHLMDGIDLCDIDRMAHLNTLFGYDIGADNALKIDAELWINPKYWDSQGFGIETMELSYKDKDFVKQVCNEIGLNLSFDNWAKEDFKCYKYF